MGIALLHGRSFTDRDGPTGPKVAILNEAAARTLFPDGHALGRRIGESLEKSGEFEVVGGCATRNTRASANPAPRRCIGASGRRRSGTCTSSSGPRASRWRWPRRCGPRCARSIRRCRFRSTSQTEHIAQRFAQERLFARAYAGFGALAVLLACIGLFGLTSYNVARRTSEIGVRMALGAERWTVVAMVMRESIRLVAIGIALGLAAVLWAGRFVQTVLYGLSPSDLLTIGGAVALIAVVTALAGVVPARRASNVNPVEALRQQ